jgi:hypothetical protein
MPRQVHAFVASVLLFVCATPGVPLAEPGSAWLDRVNFYRATAGLPPVVEDAALSDAALQHARYMVIHDEVKHSENVRALGATPRGAAAAALSNLAGSTSLGEPDSWAIDTWMQAPFHALGILDPMLAEVGFGIHRAPNKGIQTAAALDVISGRRVAPASASGSPRYPVLWPAIGASVPLTTHLAEFPSPLTTCPGYRAPVGLPVIAQLGPGDTTASVTYSWLAEGGSRLLDHCVFDASTYRNRDGAQQRLGRAVLASRGAIVLVPRRPLRPGASYRVVIELNASRFIDWTFSVTPKDLKAQWP